MTRALATLAVIRGKVGAAVSYLGKMHNDGIPANSRWTPRQISCAPLLACIKTQNCLHVIMDAFSRSLQPFYRHLLSSDLVHLLLTVRQ